MDTTKGLHCSANPSLILIGQYALFALVQIAFIKARLKLNLTPSAMLTSYIKLLSGIRNTESRCMLWFSFLSCFLCENPQDRF